MSENCHAIEQVKLKERGGLELSYFDLKMIEIMISLGLAKDVTYNNIPTGYGTNHKVYQLRYAGKLIRPAIDMDKNMIITFLPVGKRVSVKKYIENKISKDWIERQKRINC